MCKRKIDSLLCKVLVLCFVLVAAGCSIRYSFTGASIPPSAKSVSVAPFPNVAPLVNATFASAFVEALKDRFTSQTHLSIQDYGGDFDFEGEITGYSVAPTAIQGNETAAMNRLTVTVHVKFTNNLDEKASYDKSFSAYEDFSSAQQLTQVEGELAPRLIEKLVDDIFNAAVANW